jgi:hypothetical protein
MVTEVVGTTRVTVIVGASVFAAREVIEYINLRSSQFSFLGKPRASKRWLEEKGRYYVALITVVFCFILQVDVYIS